MTATFPLARVLGISVLCVAFAALLIALRGVLTPVFVALLLAYALDPLVDLCERAHLPRAAGIALLLCSVLGLVTLFGLLLLPAILRDFSELARALYEALTRLVTQVGPWLRARGVLFPSNAEAALQSLGARALGLGPSALSPFTSALEAALGGTASLLRALSPVLTVPVFSAYFLYDFDRMVEATRDLLPSSVRPSVVAMALEVDTVLGQFLRGQLTVMAILATLYAVGYSIIKVPLAIPIGVLSGLFSFIPYVGSGLALLFGLLMVVLHFTSIGQIVAVVVVYALLQALDGLLITPRIVGGKLGLSPLWVLFALLAFGELFGFVGVMLALPASAVIKVFVVHGLARYRQSALFRGRASSQTRALRQGRIKLRAVVPRRRRQRRDRSVPAPGSSV